MCMMSSSGDIRRCRKRRGEIIFILFLFYSTTTFFGPVDGVLKVEGRARLFG